MSRSSRPTLGDIMQSLQNLADRVALSTSPHFEPHVTATVRRTLLQLEQYIPGLDAPRNPDAARAYLRAAESAMLKGEARDGLAYALRGLAASPHDPNLCYLAATASFELGGVETSLRLLYHTLWIFPAHEQARADLQALTAYLEGVEGDAEGDEEAA